MAKAGEVEQRSVEIAELKQNQEKVAQQVKTLEADAVRFETEAKEERPTEMDESRKRELRARKEYAKL